jgi:hypothetical protein
VPDWLTVLFVIARRELPGPSPCTQIAGALSEAPLVTDIPLRVPFVPLVRAGGAGALVDDDRGGTGGAAGDGAAGDRELHAAGAVRLDVEADAVSVTYVPPETVVFIRWLDCAKIASPDVWLRWNVLFVEVNVIAPEPLESMYRPLAPTLALLSRNVELLTVIVAAPVSSGSSRCPRVTRTP